MAGGLDTFDWLKDRIKRPGVVVDLSQIKELSGIRPWNGGLEIGATTTLTEVVRHPGVREKFSILSTGAEAAASPQIRNQGTLGGNVSQDARCWYYRGGWPCYRAGGNICFADTPTAINREHAILGADRCVAVNPSDSAPALIALDAQMVVRNSKGERVVNAEDYFIGPGIDITRMTVLKPGDLLTAIRIPATWAGAQFYFEKIRDRQVWDFPLVNIASAAVFSGDRIERIRIAVNGVAAHPLRLKQVEDAVTGKPRNAATAEMAGQLAIQGAEPLRYNGYKVPLLRNLVKRAIRGVEEPSWVS
jgi:xanthine dehydrogenase YagS FAD-binding subunit